MAEPLETSIKFRSSIIIPSDTVSGMLERWYDFRKIDWVNYLEYPELTNKEVSRFLNF